MGFTTKRLDAADLAAMKGMLRLFGEVFGDLDTYQGAVPSDAYLLGLLRDETFFAVSALTRAAQPSAVLPPTN
jgi:aminoglycoside 3-N-acetyltransferase I